ncbi:MAG: single-stranded DNA-binding protein [Spirochaetales bacterium]|nr:single-stranded DNA-binding protein [Spirochaetales bacterium]
MADINRVILVGRLTRDAELRYTGGGTAVCKFSVAINRRKKTGDRWEDEAHFFDVVLFGKQGEAINQYLVKGKQVGIDGELRQNRWEQDGQPRSKVEIAAFNVQLLGGGGRGGQTQAQPRDGDSFENYDNAPAEPAGEFEDDIPF